MKILVLGKSLKAYPGPNGCKCSDPQDPQKLADRLKARDLEAKATGKHVEVKRDLNFPDATEFGAKAWR